MSTRVVRGRCVAKNRHGAVETVPASRAMQTVGNVLQPGFNYCSQARPETWKLMGKPNTRFWLGKVR
jgi:hypothetical protein